MFENFIDIYSLVQIHGYWILMLATLIEGPVSTAAGAFAASVGALNLAIVILISFAGDILADSFYFFMGRFGRKPVIDKYGHKFGLNKGRMRSIEQHLNKNFFRTLAIIKITPMLAPPGLMMIGSSKISFKKLLFNSLLIIVPVSLFFALSGYYLGLGFVSFFRYFKIARDVLLVLVFLIIGIAYLMEKKLFTKIARKIGKI